MRMLSASRVALRTCHELGIDRRKLPWYPRCKRHFCKESPTPEAPTRPALWCETLSAEECASVLPARNFIQALRVANAQPAELKRAFERIDLDSSGQLSVGELKILITEAVGEELTLEEIDYALQLLLCKYDLGRDGELSYAEFEAAVVEIGSRIDPRAYALAASVGVAFSCFSVAFPMGPVLIQSFSMTNFQFGTLTTAFAVAKLCGNIPSTVLSERYGRKPLLVGGLLCISVGMGGIAIAADYGQLLLLRAGVGLGVASMFTAANMYITDISHPLNSARSRAPMQMGMSAGMLMGPALGGFLLENLGLEPTAVGIGGAVFVTAAGVSWLLPETLQKDPNKPLLGVRDTLKSWGPVLSDFGFQAVLSWGWCYNAAFWGALSLLPLLYVDLALSPSVVGGISTANAAISLLVTPVVSRAADKFGKLSIVMLGAGVYGVCLLLIPQATSLVELMPVLVTMQIGAAMCANAQTHAMDMVQGRDRAKVPGIWNTFGDTGMLVSSFLSASLAQTLTTGIAFSTDGALLLFATALLFGAARRSR